MKSFANFLEYSVDRLNGVVEPMAPMKSSVSISVFTHLLRIFKKSSSVHFSSPQHVIVRSFAIFSVGQSLSYNSKRKKNELQINNFFVCESWFFHRQLCNFQKPKFGDFHQISSSCPHTLLYQQKYQKYGFLAWIIPLTIPFFVYLYC